MPIPVLVGGANGHPTLAGKGRLIRTSDLWVMAEDHGCARSMASGIVSAGRSRPRRRTPEETAYG
ncbi:hypothetical protein [Microvirga splendida]|uniref:Uncharacterized protein n=1 Tax=Microvirga splendida TaxID=2795727 RepID=A0ABS0Y6N5_9HYPH|nr:hypothetical protein [Microvirga splendida]MBJ6127978.1 hypothetical protein [Microvirga splendida]